MKTMRWLLTAGVIGCFLSAASSAVGAEELQPIKLPAPQMTGGKPLMQALAERKTQRNFSPADLPVQVLSDLLWAAFGINRPAHGGRTAPSAMDMQEIDIYVARADGVYLYEPKSNTLNPVRSGDIRTVTGKQDFVAQAPVNLIFVANLTRMDKVDKHEREFYAACDTGYISQNVYLFCASEGLATVARGWLDKVELASVMFLDKNQKIILAQTVGYPGQ